MFIPVRSAPLQRSRAKAAVIGCRWDSIRALARTEFEPDLSEVHIVGGIDPKLPYDYYVDVLRVIHEERPDIHLKAYTMIEVEWLARIGKRPLTQVLDDLRDAGLGSCPGGGGRGSLRARSSRDLPRQAVARRVD